MNNPERPKATHCASTEWIGQDGIKRQIILTKWPDGQVDIRIQTWWDGEDKDPMTTAFGLGQESFEALTNGIIAFRMRLGDFVLREDTGEDTGEDTTQ